MIKKKNGALKYFTKLDLLNDLKLHNGKIDKNFIYYKIENFFLLSLV